MATLELKPKYCNSVLLVIWMLILIQLCALLYNGSDPLTMCMFTDAAPGLHFALAGIHVTLIYKMTPTYLMALVSFWENNL